MKIFAIIALLLPTVVSAQPTKEELKEALRENPSDTWALYNLGLMEYLDGDFREAIENWESLEDIRPTDWQVREKLIQAYWGAGDAEAANSEIDELREARSSGNHPELAEKGFFICDQFQVRTVRVFTIEYYELQGDRPLAWKFLLKSGDEHLDHYYSVGSYPSATEFARSQGSIGPEERRFHLDAYWNDGSHATYGFYRNRPDYEKVRNQVRQIIEGARKPLSSSSPRPSRGRDAAPESTPGTESNTKADENPEAGPEARSR